MRRASPRFGDLATAVQARQGFTLPADVLVAYGGVAGGVFEQHVYPVSDTGALCPENAKPDSSSFPSFGHLSLDGRRGWDLDSYVVWEGSTPTTVLVGTFSSTLTIPEGEYVLGVTSTLNLPHSFYAFSEDIDVARFVMQTHLVVEGDAADPVDAGSGAMVSKEIVSHSFGDEEGPRYGLFHLDASEHVLAADSSVLGPGTVTINEIVNFHLYVDDDDRGSSADVRWISGSFDSLRWELVRPFEFRLL